MTQQEIKNAIYANKLILKMYKDKNMSELLCNRRITKINELERKLT
jgi:hypothetical protein